MQQQQSKDQQHRAGRVRPPPWRTNTNNNAANHREAADKKTKWLAPVERRRHAAREQLKETQKLAELIASGDSEPVQPRIAFEQKECSFPKSTTDRKLLASLKATILNDTLTARETHDITMKINSLSKNAAYHLLSTSSTNVGKNKTGKKSNKATKSNTFKPSLDDPVTQNTPQIAHLAASVNNLEGLECIIFSSPETAEYSNALGHTPLHMAVLSGYVDMVRSLCIKVPACLRYLDKQGNLALHLAVGEWSSSSNNVLLHAPMITSALIANYPRGAFVRDRNGYLPIHLAAKNGFLPGVRALLAVDASSATARSADDEALLPVDLALQGHREIMECMAAIKEEASMVQSVNSPSGSTVLASRHNSEPDMTASAKVVTAECDDLTMSIRSIALGEDESSGSSRTDERELLDRKFVYEETIEVLLMSALYKRAVFMPREESHADNVKAPFFLPIRAGICQGLQRENWDHLLQMYGVLHVHQIDRDGRTVLHTLADIAAATSANYFANDGVPYSSDELQRMVGEIHAIDPTAHTRPDAFGLIPLQLAVVNGVDAVVMKGFIDCGPAMLKAKWQAPSIIGSPAP